ncbi:hypothetical protein [Paenibacillus hexagrammi]|uniref:DUF5666 domain-containing protein n=1 Tax=Paenibacillus hexagrammi TaxID=2908839 RepID=A0ABY3SQM2_9BACL|nr:hypothetical protein [Paenibacillus sp. YPD9-1]UJF35451.1 hypothetical protein L0M14_10305 [Paenibacillus sp. YPD9-1]
MKKKIMIGVLAITCLISAAYGYSAFADTMSEAASANMNGTFKAISDDQQNVMLTTDQGDQTLTIAKSVWVYRNNQKAQLADLAAGDSVEIIFNSKHQAAYIKAQQPNETAVALDNDDSHDDKPASETAALATSPAPTSAAGLGPLDTHLTPAPDKTSSPTAQPITKKASPDTTIPKTANLLELKVTGNHFKLQYKQTNPDDAASGDLIIESDHGAPIHVKGNTASEWIGELLGDQLANDAEIKQTLVNAIAEHYELDKDRLDVQVKNMPKQGSVQQDQHGKPDKRSKDHDHESKKHGKD